MRNRTTWLFLATIVCILWAGVLLARGDEAPAAPAAAPVETRDVDLVICLDTSGSMSGLIESAKQKLWAIVSELATAKPRPRLRVALYQYGNTGLDPKTGWVQQLCPLTDNLDEVYGKLFKLTTNGGDEYVARVSRAALADLSWSKQKNALKMIVVAGNEPATQDPEYKLQDVCKQAAGSGVIINTIFCGPEAEGRDTGWADAARWADGQYSAIDQNGGTVVVATPYDKKLADLSAKLNTTYVAYGKGGQARAELQAAQDANAAAASPAAAAQRANAKSTGLYTNASWDVVDAVKDSKLDLETAKADELPEEMRSMTPEQRKAHVAKLQAERTEIQKEIQTLSAQRDAYQKKEMEKQGLDESKSFDANLRRAIREQGEAKGMSFGQ